MRHPCVLDWWHLRNAQYTLRREWYTGEWKIYTFTLVFLSMNSSFHSTFLPYVFVYATQYARTYLRILPWSPNWMVESAFRSPCSHSCPNYHVKLVTFEKIWCHFLGNWTLFCNDFSDIVWTITQCVYLQIQILNEQNSVHSNIYIEFATSKFLTAFLPKHIAFMLHVSNIDHLNATFAHATLMWEIWAS